MPRPGLQVMTRYTSCTHMDRSPLLYVHVGLPEQPTKAAWCVVMVSQTSDAGRSTDGVTRDCVQLCGPHSLLRGQLQIISAARTA